MNALAVRFPGPPGQHVESVIINRTHPRLVRRAFKTLATSQVLDWADKLIEENRAMKQRGADFLAATANI